MNEMYNINNYRGEDKKENKKEKKIEKFDFIKKRDTTLHSLREVERLLRNLDKVFDCVKLYKILK